MNKDTSDIKDIRYLTQIPRLSGTEFMYIPLYEG